MPGACEWDTDRLSESLGGTFVYIDDAGLSGTRAGPDRELGGGAVRIHRLFNNSEDEDTGTKRQF